MLQLALCRDLGKNDFAMSQRLDSNPVSEHQIYLRLFITNGGGL